MTRRRRNPRHDLDRRLSGGAGGWPEAVHHPGCPHLALQHAFLLYLAGNGVRSSLTRPRDKTMGQSVIRKASDMRNGIFHLVTAAAVATALSASSAHAQKKYDTGASDTEIKIGQTVPFSGPASAYATIGRAQAAYIKMINDQGGVNGRKINLIQYDD